jgi:hypothetical protein
MGQKQGFTATNNLATIEEEFLEAVFSELSMLWLYNEDTSRVNSQRE